MMGFSFFKIKSKLRPALIIGLCAAVMLFAGPVTAQGPDHTINETEKAVFAFFRLADATPNYAQWIEGTPGYKKETSMSRRQKIYEEESLRLKWGFARYEPSLDLLKIKTDVYVQLQNTQEGPTLNFKFPDSGRIEIPYFPYPYGDEWVALIVSNLGDFTTIALSPEQQEHISEILKTGGTYKAKLELHIQPKQADITKPVNLDGVEAWFMSGKAEYLSFTYPQPESGSTLELWSYSTP